jgi:uncharacterized protein (TIGR02001 family)
MKYSLSALVSALILSSGVNASPFDVQVGVVSDYVYRGISQSGEDPAVQALVKFRPAKNWFVKGFVSEVESAYGGNLEFEFGAGYQIQLDKNFNLMIEGVYNLFSDEQTGDSDYAEANIVLDYKKLFQATLGHTFDYYGSGDSATYLEGRLKLPLHDVIKTAAYVGYYSLEDTAGESYSLFGFDAWTDIGKIKFKVSFTDTDIEHSDMADSRIFVNASYRF